MHEIPEIVRQVRRRRTAHEPSHEVAELTPFEFERESIDAAIHFGHPAWLDAESVPLMGEAVVPMAGPALYAPGRYRTPNDLLSAPLLDLGSRADAWERWFAENGVPDQEVHGPVFDQFETIARAAQAGLGVALLPRFLFEDEIGRGDLVPLLDVSVGSEHGYHFVWPTDKGDNRVMATFRDWIVREASEVPARPHDVP